MKKQLWLGILLIGVFLINFAGQGELTCHYNLSGQLSSLYRKELVVNFSHDMVALGGKRDGTKIVSLTPVVAGEFLWRGTKTLVFKPKTRFNYSTTYSLKIKKGTRSRQGQVLKKSRSWTFTTPLAYPAQFRCQSQRYYRNIRNNGSYEYGVGHKDNLFIKFNQTVTPVQVKKYLFFKENKFGKAEKLEVEKRSSREMIIKFIKPLSRETPYLMVLKRGFPGLEGNRGTAEDFKYEFNTIPNFRFTSPPNRIIFIDGRDMNLHFTNSLKTVLKDQVRVYKFAPGEKKTFSDFSLSTRNKYVYLRFGKSIKSGDAFVVVLDKRISNIYNEILGKEIEVKVGVCSSKKPTIGHYLNSGGLTIDSKSIEDYRVQLFHFKPKFYNFITQFQPTQVRSGRIRDYTRNFRRRYRNSFYSGHRKGCLVEKDFYDLYVKTNKSFVKHAEIDGINRHNLSFRQILGEACGFYGALVDRALPYNICNNRDTKFFWNYYQPYLDVFHKRNIEFLVQIFPRQSLILAYNKHTLQPLAAAPMIFARPGKNLFTKTTNTRGLVDVDQRLESDQWIRINNPDQAQDFSFLKLNYSVRDKNNLISTKPVLTIFTDRMYYLPGDTVHLGGVIKEMEYGQLNKPGLSSALIRVRGPDRKEVKSWTVKLDQWGGFYTSFKSDPQGKKGEYDFTVQYKKENANVWAKIDYYQPNKLKVEISKVKDRYSWKDSFKALVTGTYLSGNPMANDKLKYGLYCHASGYLSGFFENKKLAEYTFTLDSKFTKGVLELSKEAKFDGSGRFRFSYPLKKMKGINYLGRLQFTATAESKEGKEFHADQGAFYFPVNRIVGIKMSNYVPLKKGLTADLVMVTSKGVLTSGKCRLSLYKVIYKKRGRSYWDQELKKVKVFDDFQMNKQKTFAISLKEPGRYLVRCDSFGPENRILSTSRYVYVWSYSSSLTDDKFNIDIEKEKVKVGDTVRLYVRSPKEGLGLLTIAQHDVLEKRTFKLKRTTPLDIKITDKFYPFARIKVMGIFKNGVTHEDNKTIRVESDKKKLNLDLRVAGEVKPATDTRIKLQVTGADKKRRKAKVFVFCVDEGNLSLSSFKTPNLFEWFYGEMYPWIKHPVNRFSKSFNHWRFYHPHQDLLPGSQGAFGRVVKADGEPFVNLKIKLIREKGKKELTTITTAQGFYFFDVSHRENWDLAFDIKGYKSHYFVAHQGYGLVIVNVVMFSDKENKKPARFNYSEYQPTSMTNEIVVAGQAPVIDTRRSSVAQVMTKEAFAKLPKGKKFKSVLGITGGGGLEGIKLRQDFKEVLFFKVVETDNMGRATVNFKTSDSLSTFRIMAVAYNEDQFGSGDTNFLVSKKLLLEEAMPEFAREHDRFKGGVQVSNRKNQDVRVEVLAKPEGISIPGDHQKRFVLARKKNQLVQFDFLADTAGEAQIKFYALAPGDDDGLLKILPVYQNFVPETVLDFDVGKEFKKGIVPVKNAFDYRLNLILASSIVKPARGIAGKLIRYPYGCLEQRTSRAMPFLVMEADFIKALDLDVNLIKMRQKIQKYLDEIPKFRYSDGTLSYYQGGRYGSDYLTLYVLWAMKLARARDFSVDEQLMKDLEALLRRRRLNKGNSCFYQYLLSMDKRASTKKLKSFFMEREQLSWLGRAFLFRAINNQLKDQNLLNAMVQEFNNRLQIEADFAYFEVGERYDRSIPFYSSRYATALLLQAMLEVKGKHQMAPRIVRWLLEVKPWYWHTTQTNFWILYAIQEYVRHMEELGRKTVAVNFLDVKREKVLEKLGDRLLVEKKMSRMEKEFDVNAKADKQVYLTTQLSYKLSQAPAKSRGIKIIRNIYNKKGEKTGFFKKGDVYMVELLVETDKEVPYGVIDEPLAAGFEVMRQDVDTGRKFAEFNRDNAKRGYYYPWLRRENAADRTVFYSYRLNGKARVVYFIKAMYSGEFTWLPCLVQGMYHPQYFGRTGFSKVKIIE